MQPTTLQIVLAVIAALVVIAIVVLAMRSRASTKLKSRFGPEYARAVEASGGKAKAEAELRDRQKRVEKLDIRPLAGADRTRFTERWSAVQTRFVDDPGAAVGDADALVGEVMAARGYPMVDFDQRAADISVDHPAVVDNYRAGHAIALTHAKGQASTEDLRQAMVRYRSLFDELVADGAPRAPAETEQIEERKAAS
jgi:hypothetical protein